MPVRASATRLNPIATIELVVVPSKSTPSAPRSPNAMCVAGDPHTPFAGLSNTKQSSHRRLSSSGAVDQSMLRPETRALSLEEPTTPKQPRSNAKSGFRVSARSGSHSFRNPPRPHENNPTPSTYSSPSTSAL